MSVKKHLEETTLLLFNSSQLEQFAFFGKFSSKNFDGGRG